MKQRGSTIEVIALLVLFLAITTYTVVGFAAKVWAPPPASAHGPGVDSIIKYLMYTTGAVLVLGTVIFLWLVWKFGRGQRANAALPSARAEKWWSLAPVIGIAILAEVGVAVQSRPVWNAIYGPAPSDAMLIEVTGQQFEWIVRYPGADGVFGRARADLVQGDDNPAGLDRDDPASHDDILSRNALHLPAGREILIRLRGRDVLHSFSIPAFRVKQDVVPGMAIPVRFVPTVPGRYEIACAELCGAAHYRMRGRAIVYTPEEFEAWLSSQVGFFQ